MGSRSVDGATVAGVASPSAGTDAGVGEPEYTIDELAARTGMTVRTVRFYATEGLLPPPRRRGRIAYYDQRHRLRLDLIRTLQGHGYTLAAIERVLARIPSDAEPSEYAVHSAVLAPWLPDQTEELDRAGLERRTGRRLNDDELRYLATIGALEETGDGRYRASPSVLGHAVELMRLPVPASVLHDSADIIGEHATAVADGLTDVFVKAIWGPYQRGELDDEQVVAMLSRLRPLAVQGLVSAFVHAADRAARRNITRLAFPREGSSSGPLRGPSCGPASLARRAGSSRWGSPRLRGSSSPDGRFNYSLRRSPHLRPHRDQFLWVQSLSDGVLPAWPPTQTGGMALAMAFASGTSGSAW